LRFGVLCRKRILGTQRKMGNQWVERILSLTETCRLNAKPTCPFPEEGIAADFRNSTPDLSWIRFIREYPVNAEKIFQIWQHRLDRLLKFPYR
jgi:hypothetical protein